MRILTGLENISCLIFVVVVVVESLVAVQQNGLAVVPVFVWSVPPGQRQ